MRAFLYLRSEKPYSSGILILRALDRSCATLFFLGRICTRSGLKSGLNMKNDLNNLGKWPQIEATHGRKIHEQTNTKLTSEDCLTVITVSVRV